MSSNRKHIHTPTNKFTGGVPVLAFAFAALLTTGSSRVEAESAITRAINGGKPLLRMHARSEFVDDESNALDSASAVSLRTYFGYQTGELSNFSVRVAAENVLHIVDDFNVPGEATNGFDVVADPQGTEIEEAFLRYTGFEDTKVTVGRQYLTYRPAPLHRYIGTVPWRQNWQSMDAVSIENKSIDGLSINYAYVQEVNRIFGNNNPNENLASAPMNSHLVNLQYSGLPLGSLEAFYYRLDYDNDALPAPFTDRATFGAKLQGSRELAENLTATYLLEFAHQRAIEDNSTDFDSANQYRLEFALTSSKDRGAIKSITGKVGYEVLESDGGISFSTPLATVHAFQGWADRFIGFPGAGVRDAYLIGSLKLSGGLALTTALHNFQSDAGNIDYGNELDLQLTKKYEKFTFAVKHASYFGSDEQAAGAIGVDKTVSWLFVNYAL